MIQWSLSVVASLARKRRVKSGSRKKKKLQNVREDDLSKIEPPVPITVTNSFQATSGVSNYKDFLRCLPIHLAKYILGEHRFIFYIILMVGFWKTSIQDRKKISSALLTFVWGAATSLR